MLHLRTFVNRNSPLTNRTLQTNLLSCDLQLILYQALYQVQMPLNQVQMPLNAVVNSLAWAVMEVIVAIVMINNH